MSLVPYLLVIVVLGGLLLVSQRKRRRQVAEEMLRVSQLDVGSEVMTTSGLYGTVVRRNDDQTVLLAIAPGVEVRWALAALRDAESLPDRYRPGLGQPGDTGEDGDAGTASGVAIDRPEDGDAA